MVTQAELQQQLEELKKQEALARQVSREEIPQRRFGTGVTRQTQQDIIERRQQAQQVLQQISAQRIQIKQTQGQLQSIASLFISRGDSFFLLNLILNSNLE